MNAHDVFEISFSSELFRVKQVLDDVIAFVTNQLPDLADEDKSELRLIYSELLCNAVIHGNQQNTNKRVRLYINIIDDTIFSSITDEGPGFDYLKLIDGLGEHRNLMCENGRGIRLVYSLTDRIFFNVRGNEIKFYKRMSSNV